MKILTPRLELLPITHEMICADLHRRDELSTLINATLGAGWPPELLDVSAMEWLKRAHDEDPNIGSWTWWYWITRSPRVLIGGSGFKSRPQNGEVEIGYSVLPIFQRQGFATEAMSAKIEWAFANGVERLIGETLPELIPSQALLRKCGFTRCDGASEPGVIRFERWRTR
jgi:[ribosomal protein S5]-alanine N-acetyltransferase